MSHLSNSATGCLLGLCLSFAWGQREAQASAPNESLQAVVDSNAAWQFGESEILLNGLARAYPDDARVTYLIAEKEFLEGDYSSALSTIDQAIANAGAADAERFGVLRERIAATLEVTKNHEKKTSADGRFQISYPPGKDEVLADLAFEALAAGHDAFVTDFGVSPATPIRIEVYDSAADLAKVSALTEQNIADSGTIALCKYNRLMITSPKALVRGYGWTDTLVHEYAHMVINIGGRNNVPIWLHEGLAKFSERRWRGGDEERRLTAYGEWILHERAQKGELITFEQMHPSMALLPTQEDTATAFAEVYAAVEMLYERGGSATFRALIEEMSEGAEVEDAIAKAYGQSFETFLVDWKEHLLSRERRYKGDEAPKVFEEVAFRTSVSVDDSADLELIEEDEGRRTVHLGDLLYAKDRIAASVVEYRKATKIVGDTNPVLQSRLGRALLDSGQPVEAAVELRRAVEDGEMYGTLYVTLGEALVASEQWNEADAMLREAASINPFDPAVHVQLAKVYRHFGQTEEAERSERNERIVTGHLKKDAD